jgi:ribosome maturation factor RimP
VENQRFFDARLAGYAGGVVQLTVKDHEIAVPYAAIQKAHLVVEF